MSIIQKKPQEFATLALLRAITVRPGEDNFFFCEESNQLYNWNDDSTKTDNGDTVIKLTAFATGRLEVTGKHLLTPWISGANYKVGDIVYTPGGDSNVPDVDELKIWRATTANSDTAFTRVKWQEISGGGGSALKSKYIRQVRGLESKIEGNYGGDSKVTRIVYYDDISTNDLDDNNTVKTITESYGGNANVTRIVWTSDNLQTLTIQITENVGGDSDITDITSIIT